MWREGQRNCASSDTVDRDSGSRKSSAVTAKEHVELLCSSGKEMPMGSCVGGYCAQPFAFHHADRSAIGNG